MIELSGEDHVAGGRVSGQVVWPTSRELPQGRVTVWLVWSVSIKQGDMKALGSRVTEDYAAISSGEFPAARTIPFDFRIPAQGPVTYSGELFGIDWDIVVGTRNARGEVDVLATRKFVVACRSASAVKAP